MNMSNIATAAVIAFTVVACEARSHAPKSTSDAGAEPEPGGLKDGAATSLGPDGASGASLDAADQNDREDDVSSSSDTGAKPAVCGNGIVETGEQCDPPGTCPVSCPNQGCTKFSLQGSAAACTALCVVVGMQTACVHDDGCCPSGCNTTSDRDCGLRCGNGMVEGGETCDPVSSCMSMQAKCTSDKDTVRVPSGDASKCAFTCAESPRVCGMADGYCPSGCSAGDVDCKKGMGQVCGGNAECATGVCANGYCCNQGCSTACHSCAAADTGQPNGTCAPVTANKACSPRTCSNGDVFEGRCSGGSCQPEMVQACKSNEQCTGAMCVATCGNEGQSCCIFKTCNSSSLFCNDNIVCQVKLVDGSACQDQSFDTRDDWCKSNYCGRGGICSPCGGFRQNCCTSGTSACHSPYYCGSGCPNNMPLPGDKDSLCGMDPADPSFCK
jgi:hypothetical protein